MLLADLTIGPHEVAGAIGLISSIGAFFIALWIKNIGVDIHGLRDDIHDLVATVGEHSERIAKLEVRVEALEKTET